MAREVRAGVEELYDELFGPLVRLAHLIVLDGQEARDVVQDCFAGAIARWDEIEDPRAYLRRSVANRSYRAVRDRRRRHEKAERWRAGAPLVETGEPDVLADAIVALPPKQRAVVVLRFYVDLSTDDIAAALDVPRGSVGPTLGRALARLKQEVER
ncbi:MAG: sigma-70 family RNA polymerase sigma factor [Acidimicrobiales bacterium]